MGAVAATCCNDHQINGQTDQNQIILYMFIAINLNSLRIIYFVETMLDVVKSENLTPNVIH